VELAAAMKPAST